MSKKNLNKGHNHKTFKSKNPNRDLEALRRKTAFSTPDIRYQEWDEEEKRVLAESRNLFDFEELVGAADIPKKLVLPELGFHVNYCSLTSDERNKIRAIQHHDKEIRTDMQNRKALAMMIQKANPDVPDMEAKVNNLPGEWIDAILLKIGVEANSFLLPLLNDALRGLNKTRMHRENF